MTSEGVYDKSRWPLQAPDLFWALSDDLEQIGQLGAHDENFAEYEIDAFDLPDASMALHNVNALRNIKICIYSFPRPLRRKIRAAGLCLGNQTLEYVTIGDSDTLQFTIFSKENILPFFILDEKSLVVRIFFEDLDSDEETLLPYKCVDAEGLLVRIKNTRKAFFVAACTQSIVTWTGKSCIIKSQLNDEGLNEKRPVFRISKRPNNFSNFVSSASDEDRPKFDSNLERDDLKESPKTSGLIAPQALENFSNYKDLWNALPLSPKPRTEQIISPINNPESDSEESFHLF